MQPTVIQDAEIHRQHVRLRVPIAIEIDGTRHIVDDWSVNGCGINASLHGRQPGDRLPATLVLPFEDFELRLQIECLLIYVLPDHSRFGCQFIGLSAGQLALFRFIVESYLAGEVVAGADLFAVISREAAGEARMRQLQELATRQEGKGRRLQRALALLLLTLVGVGLGLLVAAGVYERYFVVSTRRAVIEAPLYTLRATIAGTVEAGEKGLVHPGDPVASLRPPAGAAVPLPSPCECVIDEWVLQPGDQARPGEVVAVLVAADRPLVARAELPLAQARRLRVGQAAEITVPGQAEPYQGQIEALSFKLPPPRNGAQRSLGDTEEIMVPVTVRPDRPFDFDNQGYAVSIRFL